MGRLVLGAFALALAIAHARDADRRGHLVPLPSRSDGGNDQRRRSPRRDRVSVARLVTCSCDDGDAGRELRSSSRSGGWHGAIFRGRARRPSLTPGAGRT
jgi:hypothetical protein